jgi:hypothetical protein
MQRQTTIYPKGLGVEKAHYLKAIKVVKLVTYEPSLLRSYLVCARSQDE